LIGGDGAGIATVKLSMQNLLDTLSALYRQTNIIDDKRKSLEKLDELLSIVTNAAEQRNKIVHSFWYIHVNDTNKPLTRVKRNLKRKFGLLIDMEQMNIEDLDKVDNIIFNAAAKTQDFINDIWSNFVVVLISPADKAVFLDTKPELAWLGIKNAVGYELAISEKYPQIDYSVSKMGEDFIRDTKYKFETSLERNTKYYWRVRPKIETLRGYWSEIRSFTVQ
jgi:hypothetical protein